MYIIHNSKEDFMRVCVITNAHPPDDIRIIKQLKTLKKIAEEVHYIAPNGYFGLSGIRYHSIPRYNRMSRFVHAGRIIFRKALEIDADVYHFHDPDLLPIGHKLKKHGKKVIYDSHENYPEVIKVKGWIPRVFRPIVSRLFKMYEERVVANLDGVVAVTENVCERFSKFTHCVVIPNYPDPEDFKGIVKKERNDNEVRFIYMGSIDIDRAIKEMLEAFSIVANKHDNVKFTMIGNIYSRKLKNIIMSYADNYENFEYIPFMPHEKVFQKVAEHDIGMLVIKGGNLSKEISSPVKMFEYIYLGLPIIASDFSYWRKILDKSPCALYVNPDDPEDIAEKMEIFIKNVHLRSTYSKNALKLSQEFSWSSLEKRLIKFYERVALLKTK